MSKKLQTSNFKLRIKFKIQNSDEKKFDFCDLKIIWSLVFDFWALRLSGAG
jgi:hypothetical protein